MNSYAIYRITETLRGLLFETPLGWGWAGFVWGHALLWALVNDRVKLLAYWIIDREPLRLSGRPAAAGDGP